MTTGIATFMDVLRELAAFADVADVRNWNYDDSAIISEWGVHEGIRAKLTLGHARYARDFIHKLDKKKAEKKTAVTKEKPQAAFG